MYRFVKAKPSFDALVTAYLICWFNFLISNKNLYLLSFSVV